MRWERLPHGYIAECASVSCGHAPAKWHMESGGKGSCFCDECCRKLDPNSFETAQWRRLDLIEDAARFVLTFDWSDNDADAVAAIDRLRAAVS